MYGDPSVIDSIQIFYSFLIIACSFLCLLTALKLFKKNFLFYSIIYFIFFSILFLLFFELIHWGQLIFNFDTVFLENNKLIENELALHEIADLRPFFEKAFDFFVFYICFFWLFFRKKGNLLKTTTTRLFVVDGLLFFYFFPSVLFILIVNSISFVTYSSNADEAVIKGYSWLFTLQNPVAHYSRPLASIGLLLFFAKNFIWLNSTAIVKDTRLKYNSKLIIGCIICLTFMGFLTTLPAAETATKYSYIGWGKFCKINNDFIGAIHFYDACIKLRFEDEHIHKELFLLYQRIGADNLAINHLAEAIKQSMMAGNRKTADEIIRKAIILYPDLEIDLNARKIYRRR
jgi:hypothetical protein